jgi:hypothetical protein
VIGLKKWIAIFVIGTHLLYPDCQPHNQAGLPDRTYIRIPKTPVLVNIIIEDLEMETFGIFHGHFYTYFVLNWYIFGHLSYFSRLVCFIRTKMQPCKDHRMSLLSLFPN